MGMWKFVNWAFLPCFIVFLSSSFSAGADSIFDPALNPRWHFSEKTALATFLGSDKPETARLILTKSRILGQTITVDSDATYIVLQSGSSPHVIFKIPENANGTSTKLVMTGGDQAAVILNDREQDQQQGRWIQIVTANDATLTVELDMANFAKVKFEAPVEAVPPVAVAPTPSPAALDKPAAQPELLHTVSPDELRAAINGFDQGIRKKCPLCGGTGKISVKVQTGTQQQGIYSVPTYADQQQKCTRCGGTGIDRAKDDVLIIMAGKIVKDLAGLKTDDPKAAKAMTDTYDEITRDMIGDQKSWKLLTANGRSILAQPSPKPDTTLVTLVVVKKSLPTDGHRRFLVRVLGTGKEVYVDNPTLADELKAGRALMGGMIADPVESGKTKIEVLRGGFLIAPPINRAWSWWNKD